jgi:hypothetical protein
MHHWFVFIFMLLWMAGPLVVYGMAPRKNRDPYLWVFGCTIFGPLVAAVYLLLPRAPKAA